ncbi:MAG: DUF2961 domain-containing protein [Armatimonadota bacterium]|nr:DUF2961 domain-containing protein [Armatimonadota bacterium]
MPETRLIDRVLLALLVATAVCGLFAVGEVHASKKGDRNKVKESQWFQMPDEKVETRWYTWENPQGAKGEGGKARSGRKGAPCTGIAKNGGTLVLADIQGSGTIRRIWMTPGPRDADMLRGCKIEIYWDGAKTPAVQAPLGDFFCHSLGHMVAFENACFSSPEARSMNCFIPMPFRKSAKIQITNESPKPISIYYDVAVTLGDKHNDETLYFHSYWRRENYTTVRRDMTILPQVKGRGRFLGCNLGVRLHPSMTNFWWGEGEVKAYLDGDKEFPTLCGTGTEDYIGTAYGQGHFAHRFQGNQYINDPKDGPANAYGFYRFHIPDPVYFRKDARVTIQVMGGPSYAQMLDAMAKDTSLKFMKAGEPGQYYTKEELEKEPNRADVMERIDDHCATAYWYMDKPENGLPAIAGFAERIKDLP